MSRGVPLHQVDDTGLKAELLSYEGEEVLVQLKRSLSGQPAGQSNECELVGEPEPRVVETQFV